MKNRNPNRSTVSRRNFIRTVGVGTVTVGALGGCDSAAQKRTSRVEEKRKNGSHPLIQSHLATLHDLEADVVIVGGGMSGVCATIAAARNGATVTLLQDRSLLGGNASSEVRMHIVGADCHGSRKDTDARESGILEEIRLEDAVWNPQRSASVFDYLLYEQVRREPNINLLLNTHARGVEMASPDRIAAVMASRPGTEDEFRIRGKLFIDCSGDGRLGAEAGAHFRVGRESREEYGESMAPAKADRKVLGSSILFTSRQYDRPMPFRAPHWIHKFPACEDLPLRGHDAWEYGYWWVEWGGELDTIKEDERIREELIAAAFGVWDHIKNSGRHPQSANWALEWVGAIPGKRESRRFVGDYVLKQQDLQNGESFADAVAYGGWPIDLHPPEGIYSREPSCEQIQTPLYGIPFRSLYSRNISNLLFAGRNASASHVAFASTRVMGTCSVMGQAVGAAAALCVRHRAFPRAIAQEAVNELQQLLLKDDAYLIGVGNRDPHDLARAATVRASSEVSGSPATDVINGVHRGVYGTSNRWISDPNQHLPQWVELRFRDAKRIREIHLVFDTGLNRQLTLSHSDSTNKTVIRAPQPETVRDYELQVLAGNEVKPAVQVEGNYQRKRIHRIEPTTGDGIRLLVQATNGDRSARIFEIRAYE